MNTGEHEPGGFRRTLKTKDLLVFMVFLCVAAVFWLLISLDNEVQRSYDVPVVIEDMPDSLAFATTPPDKVTVLVKDKGTRHLKYYLFGPPQLKVGFHEYLRGNRFKITHSDLTYSMHRLFGESMTLAWISPDSISIKVEKPAE